MRLRLFLAFGLSVLCGATAEAGTGRTGAILLREPFGARPFALGQAYSALGDDIFGLPYNPAILSRLPESQFSVQYLKSIADVELGALAFGTPLSPRQAVGASFHYLDAGKSQVFDAAGNPTGQVSVQKDQLFQLHYGYSLPLRTGTLRLGGSGKAFRSVLFEDARATAFAADLGTIYERPWGRSRASVALVAANLGPDISYSGGLATSQADPLPRTYRFGVGLKRDVLKTDSAGIGLQLERLTQSDALVRGLGIEYTYRRLMTLRLGYRHSPEAGRLSLGFGLAFKGLSVDYGLGLLDTFDNVQQLSLCYRFNIPGIDYGRSDAAAAIEPLARKSREAVASSRYFDAAAETERIAALFPDSYDAVRLNEQIQAEINAILAQGVRSPRYHYAVAFKHYREGYWQEAQRALEISLEADPGNEEIKNYLQKIRDRQGEVERQLTLHRQARVGTLFELANQAFEKRELARASRILDEILRLGPYQPAESLKKRIQAEGKKAAPEPARAPAPSAWQPSPEQRIKAEQLYYDALRHYAESDFEAAIKELQTASKLNPENESVKNTLETIQKVYRQQREAR